MRDRVQPPNSAPRTPDPPPPCLRHPPFLCVGAAKLKPEIVFGQIVRVDGRDTRGMKTEDVVSLLRRVPLTLVTVTVVRPVECAGSGQDTAPLEFDVALARDAVRGSHSPSHMGVSLGLCLPGQLL